MEGCAALGAAAAIVQFISLSISLVSKTREIHVSASGSSQRNTDLTIVERSLSARTTKIRDVISADPLANEEDEVILTLCNRCLEISKELQTGLRRVKVQGERTKWRSVRHALKSIWMREDIEALRDRLVDVRSELDSHITLSLPSRIDFVLLKQSEDFAKLEKDAQGLLDTILDTQAALSEQIGDSAVRVDSVVLATAQTTQDAIEEARSRNEDGHARSHLQLDRLEHAAANSQSDTARSTIRALNAIEELHIQQQTDQQQTRETIETLAQQERSAQQQIARLEQEIKNLKEMIQKGLHLLMHGVQSEQQQKQLKNDTNLWYKLWAAKEVMLQKLKEFVALIKSRLSNQTWLPHFPSFDLRSYEAVVRSAWSRTEAEPQELQTMATEQGRMLMHFIESANPILCRNFIAQDVINLRLPLTFDVRLLSSNESAKRFYTTIYPRARVDRDWDGRPATPAESAMLASIATINYSMPLVQIHTTPIIFAVQQLGLLQRHVPQMRCIEKTIPTPSTPTTPTISHPSLRVKNLLSIIQILIDAGADLRTLDNAGLSAYDHARILGLDDNIVVKLRPPIVFDGRTIPMPAATHNAHRRIASVSQVNLQQTLPWELNRGGSLGAIVGRNGMTSQLELVRRHASTSSAPTQ